MPTRFAHRAPVVVDLEATCWGEEHPALRDRHEQECEIIEIGAVRLDPVTLAPLDEFQCFTRPTRHPVLSEFCVGLTSITQAIVDAAPPLEAALADFTRWVGGGPAALCGWGRFERRKLGMDFAAVGLESPFEGEYLDLKLEFMEWTRGQGLGKLRVGMKPALELLRIPASGTQHRGIDDARMAAALLTALREPGRMSPEARLVITHALERHPKPTHRGHLKAALGEAPTTRRGGLRAWWPQVIQELERLGLAENLAGGRGLLLTERGAELAR